MRGAIVVITTVFVVMVGIFLVGGNMVEPLAEYVQDTDSEQQLGIGGVIDEWLRILFVGVPLALIGGMTVWAVAWYLRDERFVGGGRR